MVQLKNLSISELIKKGGYDCACGRHHEMTMDYLSIGSGVIREIPAALAAMGVKKPFVICDRNTKAAAWDRVKAVLDEAGIEYVLHCLPMERVEPDEKAMGSILMAYDRSCDCVMGIGSGVINDCSKTLSYALRTKLIIVGTAPSMDGYASNCSAMLIGGAKATLVNAAPDAIICDIDIIKEAPMRMLRAGFGDMLAKYIAMYEWRMASVINGEYYCENIADLMRAALKKIIENAPKMAQRDPQAVQATTEGLVLSGIAMSYAGNSRPASGFEHYFSHLWEMMALERGIPFELHGIQVGVGTLQALRFCDKIRELKPSREKAEAFFNHFDRAAWESELRRIFGSAAETLIRLEDESYHNNDPKKHAYHLDRILENWEDVVRFMDEELPDTKEIEDLMTRLGVAMTPEEIGFTHRDMLDAFHHARDTRNKYLTSSMLWDMGELYEMNL